MRMTEKEWEAYCKAEGTFYMPLWKLRSLYADMPLPLRLYCKDRDNIEEAKEE